MFIAIKARIIRETNNKGWQFCQSSATQADKLTSKKRTETEEFMNENGKVGPGVSSMHFLSQMHLPVRKRAMS
jgi:hypothetical protein